VFESRKRPFDGDASPSPTSRHAEAERAWRQQVGDAARRAAYGLDKDNRELRQLHADLVDLAARLTTEDDQPAEPDDPRQSPESGPRDPEG